MTQTIGRILLCGALTWGLGSQAYVNAEHAVAASGASPRYAVIHYYRGDGDYGDHQTGNFNDFWGLHLWGDGIDPAEATAWASPKPFLGNDDYGRFAWIRLSASVGTVNYIVHRGDVRDGTPLDRQFNANANPQIWLRQDDANAYATAAVATDRMVLRYRRSDGDYGNPASPDFNNFWGLHLWGDGLDPSDWTSWSDPKRPDGIDDYGAWFEIPLNDSSQPLNFIVHRGDTQETPGTRTIVPDDTPTGWLQNDDPAVYSQRGAAQGYVTLHYHRPGGDYGDPGHPDFNQFWGLHVWTGAQSPTSWVDPIRPSWSDTFGVTFEVPLTSGATNLAYILHRGDLKDPGPDQLLDLAVSGYQVWQLENADVDQPYVLPVAAPDGDLDGIADAADNCPATFNADQRDTDSDDIGNACDADLSGDCSVNFADLAALKAAFFPRPYDADADFNGDGLVNFGDLAFLKSTFFNGTNPGPGPGLPGNFCD